VPNTDARTTPAAPVPPLIQGLPLKSLDRRILSVFIAAAANAGCWEIHLSFRQIRAGLAKNASAHQVDDATARLRVAGVLELLAESEGVGGSPRRWRIDPKRIRQLCELSQ